MTGTAMEFPINLYLAPSFRCSPAVCPSGMPWSRSHSTGINRRTRYCKHTAWELPSVSNGCVHSPETSGSCRALKQIAG